MKLVLKCCNLLVGLICTIVEAVMLGTMFISNKIYNLFERIEDRAEHAVNETVCKLERRKYTHNDGFTYPEYDTV